MKKLLALFLLFSVPAFAGQTPPPGTNGQVIYNKSNLWGAQNGEAITATATNGNTARTLGAYLSDNYNAKDFGVKCDGTTDDTTAINNMIAHVGSATYQFPPGTCVVSSTITINNSNVFLQGCGSGISSTNPLGWCTAFKWAGSAGGTMIKFTPVASGQTKAGGGVLGIFLDALGTYTAGVGINVNSWPQAYFRDDYLHEFSSAGVLISADNSGTYATDVSPVMNRFVQIGGSNTTSGTASFIRMTGASDGTNPVYNRVEDSFFETAVTAGSNVGVIDMFCADNNQFDNIEIISSGNVDGVVEHALSTNLGRGSNWYRHLSGNINLLINGTSEATYPSVQSSFTDLDNGNGVSYPTVGTGASVGTISFNSGVTDVSQLNIGTSGVGSFNLASVQAGQSQAYFASTGANASRIWIDDRAGGNESDIVLEDAGTAEWQWTKETDNSFNLYSYADTSHYLNIPAGGGTLSLGKALTFDILSNGTVGVGTATVTSGATLDVYGHIRPGGAAPAVSSCGSGSLVSGSTDQKGEITGVTTATACTLTFATALPAAPSCSLLGSTTLATPSISAISTSAVTFAMTSYSGKLYYLCF